MKIVRRAILVISVLYMRHGEQIGLQIIKVIKYIIRIFHLKKSLIIINKIFMIKYIICDVY